MSRKTPRRRRAMIEPLEPRLLFSATADIAVLDDGNSDTTFLLNAAFSTRLDQVYEQSQLVGLADGGEELDYGVVQGNATVEEIVFVDTSVENYDQLLNDILQNTDSDKVAVIVLDENSDGIEQITSTLANYSGLGALHLISHGQAGSVQFGNAIINQGNVADYEEELTQWRQALGEDADILIYGCDLAANDAGRVLVAQIAQLTDADVAASNDLTGHYSFNADWDLEVQHGEIEANVIISAQAQEDWVGALAEPAGTDNTITTDEDTAYTFALADFGFTDPDGDSLDAVRIDTLPAVGSLTLSGVAVTAGQVISEADITAGNLAFTPASDANGASYASLTFSVRDTGGLYDTTPNTLTVDVTAVNDAPVNTFPGTIFINEDAPRVLNDSGLTGTYYNNTSLSGTPVGERLDYTIDYWWDGSPGLGVNSDNFSVEWAGDLHVTETGNYYFKTISDGGIRVYIDGELVIDHWAVHGWTEDTSASVALTAGRTYSVLVEYYDTDGVAEAKLHWQTPSATTFQAVPAGNPSAYAEGFYRGNNVGVSDVDVGAGDLEVELSVSSGTLTMQSIDGLTFSIGDGGSDSTMVFRGSVADINSALSLLTYTPANNYSGDVSFSMTTSDLGNTGSGGTLGDTDTTTISVASTDNDAPTVANPIPNQTSTEGAAFSYQFASDTFSDPDVNDTLTYTAQLAGGGALPTWLSFDAVTRTFSGTPGSADVGMVSIDVVADDGNGGTVTDTFDITVTNAPVITSNGGGATAAINAAENQTAVTTVTATDADGDTPTFSINGGADAALFTIDTNTGALTFTSARDYETYSDADGDGVYEVTVTASDGTGGTDTQTISVTVTDVNDAPLITSNGGGAAATVNAAENQTTVTTVTASDADGNTPTFSISGGTDAALFSVNAATGELTFASAPDFENATDANSDGVYEVTVTASDGNGGTDTQAISITVTDVNEAPAGTDNTVTTNEDIAYTFALADFGFTDPDAGDSLDAVRIDTLPAAGSLTLSGVAVIAGQLISAADITSGNLIFTPASNASGSGYASLTFSVRDGGGLYDVAPNTLTVDVTAVNDAPIVTSNGGGTTAAINAAENQTAVTTVTATDTDGDTPTFSISGGADSALFSIDANTGEMTFTSARDFENATDADSNGVYEVEVTAADGNGGTDVQAISVTVTDVNEAPVITSNGGSATAAVNAAENQTAVTTVVASDVDGDTATFSVSGGADSALFSIDAATGALTFNSAPDFENATDADSNGVYEVEVTAADGNGGTDVQAISVTVTDVNEAPTGADSTITINEDNSHTFAAADFGFSDIDTGDSLSAVRIDTLPADGTLTLNGAAVNAADIIAVGDIGNLVFTPAANANGTGYASFTFSVRDSAGVYDATPNTLTVDVTAVNDAPTGADNTITINEDNSRTFAAADFGFSDIDTGDSLSAVRIDTLPADGTLTLSGAAVNATDIIAAGDIGNLVFTPAANANGTGYASFTFSVRDSAGVYDATPNTLTVDVTAVNDAPTVANPIPNQAAIEDTDFSYTVPTSTFDDVDAGDSLTYSATLGDGSALPAWLSFDSVTRTFTGTPNNGDVGTLSIEVTVTDSNGATAEDMFDLVIANANDAPTVANPIPDQSATEDIAFRYTVEETAFADSDAGDSLSYSAQLAGGGELPVWLTFDPATRSFSGTPSGTDAGITAIEVIASDGNGGSASDAFNITVANVNDAPISNGIGDVNNVENTAGDALDLFAAFDDEEDADEQLVFEIVGNSNSTLITSTSIDPTTGMLQLTYAADTSGSGVISVRATDSDGATVETSFTVTISPANAAPTSSGFSDVSATAVSSPGVISLRDFFADVEDGTNLTYTLVGNSNPDLAQLAALDSEAATLTLNYGFNTVGDTTITIRATDSEGAWVDSSFRVTVAEVAIPVDSSVEEPQQPPADGELPANAPPPNHSPPSDDLPDDGTPALPGSGHVSQNLPTAEDRLATIIDNLGSAPALLTPAEFYQKPDDDDRERPRGADERDAQERRMRQEAGAHSSLTTLIAPESGYLNAGDILSFTDELRRTRAEMARVLDEERQQQAAIAGITLSLTTGLLIWSLRAGSLLLTLFSMLPLWKGLDPLPILAQVESRKKQLEEQRKDRAQEDRSAREVGYLFDQTDKKAG